MQKLLPVCLAWLGFLALVCEAQPDSSPPDVQTVAPGIWRIRFGRPETFTPVRFRSAEISAAGLKNMPAAQVPPLDAAKISFQVSERGCSLQWPMMPGENVYGFGLHTRLFNMTGRRVFLEPTDKPENDLGQSHAPVPFYVSSQGYGLFVDTARFASFYTGNVSPMGGAIETNDHTEIQTSTTELYRAETAKTKTMLVDIPAAKGVDIYIFAGPAMVDAVQRYNLFSGGGALPPLWGLGVQYRGYAKYGAADTLALAARLREAHMPCDVWGVEPGWQSRVYSSSFVWDTNRFPDPNGFLKKMGAMNYRMNFWEHAFTHPASPMFNDLKPWSGNFLVWNGLVPDFASPQGRKIFLDQNRTALFDRGVESVKLDECDYQPDSPLPWSFPPATKFPSGLDGEVMHSLFGLLYQQVMWEPYRQKGVRTWGLARNSHALASPLPYAIYSDSYDARCFVRGLANSGFSGLLWTPEVRTASSVEDFLRRLEVTVFSGEALINAWFIPNPPWDQVDRKQNVRNQLMPDRKDVTAAARKILRMRMSFIPYLYAAFAEYHATGKPPIRALVLDYPREPKARPIDDEFMFGDSVLVAPMFAEEPTREIYLPPGDWFDFWTHAKITGGKTIAATNGIGEIPLFVKSGTLLPLAEPVESIQAGTCFDLTVTMFGGESAQFTLYEDDGLTTAYARGEQNQVVLHFDGDKHAVQRTGNYHGPERYKITGWKRF